MFLRVEIAGVYWPETDSASLHVRVNSHHFIDGADDQKLFHERRLELLPQGGTPGGVLSPMASFGIARWQKLIDMWAPPF